MKNECVSTTTSRLSFMSLVSSLHNIKQIATEDARSIIFDCDSWQYQELRYNLKSWLYIIQVLDGKLFHISWRESNIIIMFHSLHRAFDCCVTSLLCMLSIDSNLLNILVSAYFHFVGQEKIM